MPSRIQSKPTRRPEPARARSKPRTKAPAKLAKPAKRPTLPKPAKRPTLSKPAKRAELVRASARARTSPSSARSASPGSTAARAKPAAFDLLAELTARAPAFTPLTTQDVAVARALEQRRDAWVQDSDDERARWRFFTTAECLGRRALWLTASAACVRREAARLTARGVAFAAFETREDAARKAALDKLARGSAPLVLATVSAFSSPELEAALARGRIDVAALEDAHLASELAHELRPAFGAVGARLRRLGTLTLHALSRPVPDGVARDAAAQLGLLDPEWLRCSVLPPTLALEAQSVRGDARHAALVRWVERLHGAGLVLCATAHEVDAAAASLLTLGVSVRRAHAGMPAAERQSELDAFTTAASASVLVTTSAEAPSSGLPGLCEGSEKDTWTGFGRGDVRRDLRFLVHFHAPASLEQLARELGWLGRDGEAATAVLLYDTAHRGLNQAILGQQRLRAGHATEIGRALLASLPSGRTSSVEALAFGSGQSRRATERLVALLIDDGIVERVDGKVRPVVDADALLAGTERLAARLGRLSLRDPRTLEAVERFALGRECKSIALSRAFGVSAEQACGRCGVCDPRLALPRSPHTESLPRRKPEPPALAVAAPPPAVYSRTPAAPPASEELRRHGQKR